MTMEQQSAPVDGDPLTPRPQSASGYEDRTAPYISIGVVAFKGGVGKSTTSAGLAQDFSRIASTLLVDCDPQQSVSSMRASAVKAAHRDGLTDMTFDNVYDFGHARIDTSLGRSGTLSQLRDITSGTWPGPPIDSEADTGGQRVLIIDTPPGSAIASGVADHLLNAPRGSLVIVATPNDVDLADSLQTCRNFAESHPTLQSWILLNQVIRSRDDHKDLEPIDLGFRAFKTVVPTLAPISRMFRYDQMRSHKGTVLYNHIAAEILDYWNTSGGVA